MGTNYSSYFIKDFLEVVKDLQKTMHISQFEKPFKVVNVDKVERIFIEGYSFPLVENLEDLKVLKSSDSLVNRTDEHKEQLKPPLDQEGLLNKLRSYGIIIEESQEELAKEFILETNYYKLSIFTRFLKRDLTLDALISLYEFDRYLSNVLFELIAPIEIYLKATLANFLSLNYKDFIDSNEDIVQPSLIYLNKHIYKDEISEANLNRMLSNFAKSLLRGVGKDLTIDYHISHHGGNIPIWILFDHLTLGQLSMLLIKLKRPIVKKWTEEYVPQSWQKAVAEWINTVRILRNSVAHHNRVYGMYFTYSPIFPKELNIDDLNFQGMTSSKDKQSIKNTLFAGLFIIKQFYLSLSQKDQDNWNNFLDVLESKIAENKNIELSRMSFPNEWKEVLEISIV